MGVPVIASASGSSYVTPAPVVANAKFAGVDVHPLVATSVQGSSFELQPGKKTGRVVLQRPGWRISVDGASIDDGLSADPITVTRSLSRSVQTGSLVLHQARGISIPSPLQTLGAPSTGLDNVNVELSFLRDDGVRITEPVILSGRLDDQQRLLAEAVTDTLSVADAGSRYADFPVSYQLAEGSRVSVRSVISALAAAAGVSTSSMEIPTIPGAVAMRKPVDLAKGDWLAVAQGILDVVGGRLLWDRSGVLTVRFDRPEVSVAPSVDWVFGPRDWVYAVNGSALGIQLGTAQNAYRKLIGRASRQIINDEAGDGCGDVTTPQVMEAESVHAPSPLAFHQGAAGSASFVYTANGMVTPAPVRKKTTEVRTWMTTRCGEVVAVRTEVYTYRNIEQARYIRDTDGTITSLFSTWVEDDVDEGPVGNLYSIVQWGLSEEIVETYTFDSEGYLQKRVSEKFGWYNPRRSYKERLSTANDWETATSDVSYRDIGNGTAVLQNAASFQLIERETETFDVEGGYQMGRTLVLEGFGAIPGSLFLYASGERGQRQETFQELSRETEIWSHAGEGLSNKLSTTYSIGGQFVGSSFESNLQQAPPSARRASFAAGDGDANRLQQQAISATVSVPILSSLRPYQELPVFVEWAESVEQLSAYLKRVALSGMAPPVTFHVPVNPRVEEGDVVRLVGREGQAINVVGTVQEVLHDGPMAGPYLTAITMLAYPDVSLVVN